jgi:hypothetical protein
MWLTSLAVTLTLSAIMGVAWLRAKYLGAERVADGED